MGTHPIFESDFDCLTECSAKKKKAQWKARSLSRRISSGQSMATLRNVPGRVFCENGCSQMDASTLIRATITCRRKRSSRMKSHRYAPFQSHQLKSFRRASFQTRFQRQLVNIRNYNHARVPTRPCHAVKLDLKSK